MSYENGANYSIVRLFLVIDVYLIWISWGIFSRL